MPATLTTVDAILKEVYEADITDQLQNEAVGYKRILSTSKGVSEKAGGKYVDFPIRVRRNHGQGYRNEDEALPASGQQGYAEVHVPLKYGYGRVRFTGQLMQLARTNPQAFANAMREEMDGLKEDMVKDASRVWYGDSTGLLATITDADAATADHTVDSVLYLEVGMIVDVLVIADGTTTQLNTTIDAINASTLTVTFGDAFTPSGANLDGVYREGSFEREPSGLGLIVDDTEVLHTLDPATEAQWAATILDNGGANRALSEGLMIEASDEARTKGSKVTLALCSLGVRRAYFNLLVQQRRYTNTTSFDGGLEGLAFHNGREIPVVDDVDHPANKMHMINEKEFKIYHTQDWHWAQDDGTIIKHVSGFDAWEAFMRRYWEFATHRRNGHVLIDDVTEG